MTILHGVKYEHGLLVSHVGKQPYVGAIRSFNSAPVDVSQYLPSGLRTDESQINPVSQQERSLFFK